MSSNSSIAAGADIAAGAGSAPSKESSKSLLNSIEEGNVANVTKRLNAGESPDYKYGLALRAAVMYGQLPIVDLLLQRGTDVTKVTKESLLEIANLYSQKQPISVDIARRLIDHMLEKKLPWHSATRAGPQAGRPLIFAVAFRGTVPMMELFLEKGADIHTTSDLIDGRTINLLKVAMQGDNQPMVKFLTERGLTLPVEEEESVEEWMRKKAEVNREVIKGGRRKRTKRKGRRSLRRKSRSAKQLY